MSERLSQGRPWACSGDMYGAVPAIVVSTHSGVSGRVLAWFPGLRRRRPECQAEIQHLDPPGFGEHHVAGLEIAVRDPCFVSRGQCVGNLGAVAQAVPQRQSAGRNELGEVPALHVLHHEEATSVLLDKVVDGNDVGMAQRGGSPGFLQQTALAVGICGELGRQALQGDNALQALIARLVDHAHATFPKLFDDEVAGTRTGRRLVHMILWREGYDCFHCTRSRGRAHKKNESAFTIPVRALAGTARLGEDLATLKRGP
jgi:hypothetical protein